MEVKRFPRLHDKIVEVVINLLQRRLPSTNEMVTLSANFEYSSTLPEVDCKTVGFFFLKISKDIGKAWRKSLKRGSVRASHDCSRALEYAKRLFCSLFQKSLFFAYSILAYSRRQKRALARTSVTATRTSKSTSKTTTLYVHHAFLYISLPSMHD